MMMMTHPTPVLLVLDVETQDESFYPTYSSPKRGNQRTYSLIIINSCRVCNVISILCDVISFSVICKPCIGGARGSCGTGVCIVVLGFGRAE